MAVLRWTLLLTLALLVSCRTSRHATSSVDVYRSLCLGDSFRFHSQFDWWLLPPDIAVGSLPDCCPGDSSSTSSRPRPRLVGHVVSSAERVGTRIVKTSSAEKVERVSSPSTSGPRPLRLIFILGVLVVFALGGAYFCNPQN